MPEENIESQTILVPKSAKEKVKHSLSIESLHNRIISSDTDDNKRRELIGRQKGIMDRMENVGMVKWQDVEDAALIVIKKNKWDDVYPELQSLGVRLENEARGTAGYNSLAASEKERVNDAVKIAVDMTALEVRVQGLEQRGTNPKPGDDYNKFLHNHASSPQRLEADRTKINRGKVLFRNVEKDDRGEIVISEDPVYLAAYVGQDVVEPQDDAYQRRGNGVGVGAELSEAIRGLGNQLKENQISMNQYFVQVDKRNQELIETYRGLDPEIERERWIDVAYRQDFWSRFTPAQEPRFFTREKDEEKRRVQEDMWQLHRSAFYKKSTHFLPDRYKENQDLSLLSNEKQERLYNLPGVREMLTFYSRSIKDSTAIPLYTADGQKVLDNEGKHRRLKVWDIENENDFEYFRQTVRYSALLRERESFATNFSELTHGGDDTDKEKAEKDRKLRIEAKQADAVAWDLLWVGNQIESSDSRYSHAGKVHPGLPIGIVVSDDYRAKIHPQEKYEGKCIARHANHNKLAPWGIYKTDQIRGHFNMQGRDEIKWVPAEKVNEYWNARIIPGESSTKGGRLIEIKVPEANPVTTVKSYWEKTKIDGTTLFEHFARGTDLTGKWQDSDNSFGNYMASQFNKAVLYVDYHNGKVPLEYYKFAGGIDWAQPLMDLQARLKPEEELEVLRGEGKTYQTLGKLKAWAVISSTGGVGDTTMNRPTLKLDSKQKGNLTRAFKDSSIGYLQRGESLDIK